MVEDVRLQYPLMQIVIVLRYAAGDTFNKYGFDKQPQYKTEDDNQALEEKMGRFKFENSPGE